MFKELNILRIFLERPTQEFNIREIARMLHMAPATASTALKRFADAGILIQRAERRHLLYHANLENDAYRDLKRYFTIRRLRESGLLEAINQHYLKPTVVLFGSAAMGLDTETSDIDLCVISERTDALPEHERFVKKLDRELQIFAVRNIKDLRNPHLVNNVLNGIVLQGGVQWT